MREVVLVALAATVLLAASWWVSYHRLVVARNEVESAWADVDVELDRRHRLVPELVEIVRGTAAHERQLIVELTSRHEDATRAAHAVGDANRVEPPLADAVGRVLALRERYPELHARESFLALQRQLSLVEDRIAAARRYYNTRVEELNRRVAAFPSAIVARRHAFGPAAFFDA
jgi:LemA protein